MNLRGANAIHFDGRQGLVAGKTWRVPLAPGSRTSGNRSRKARLASGLASTATMISSQSVHSNANFASPVPGADARMAPFPIPIHRA